MPLHVLSSYHLNTLNRFTGIRIAVGHMNEMV